MSRTLLAANGSVDLTQEYQLGFGKTVASVYSTPADVLNKIIIPNIFPISAAVMLALFVGGGISIIMADDNSKGVEKGMQIIRTAIIGFLVIFSGYWIVQIAQIVTGVNIFNSGI